VTCPAGFACPEGTGTAAGANLMIQCEPGYYCPSGSTHTRQTPCPAGKYNPTRGSSASSDCQACQAGYFCPIGSYRITSARVAIIVRQTPTIIRFSRVPPELTEVSRKELRPQIALHALLAFTAKRLQLCQLCVLPARTATRPVLSQQPRHPQLPQLKPVLRAPPEAIVLTSA